MARKLGVGVENAVSEMLLESLLGQGVPSYPKALSSQGLSHIQKSSIFI